MGRQKCRSFFMPQPPTQYEHSLSGGVTKIICIYVGCFCATLWTFELLVYFLYMLKSLILRKATFTRIAAILDKEGFVYTNKDVEDLLKGNQKGVRYGNAVLFRKEGDTQQKRFVKIVLDGTWGTYKLFRRQVRITAALHEDPAVKTTTMAVVKISLTGPLPYAIFETREDGKDFGFMHDTPKMYKMLSEWEVRQLVEVMYTFHRSGLLINKSTLRYARHISSQLRHYKNECKKLLEKKIVHRYRDGFEVEKTVRELLASYTGVSDIDKRIMQLFEKNWEYVNLSKIKNGSYLVHADM